MGNHRRRRRPSDRVVVKDGGGIECGERTDNEPPDDENTDDADGGCLAGQSLTKGSDDHDHEFDTI